MRRIRSVAPDFRRSSTARCMMARASGDRFASRRVRKALSSAFSDMGVSLSGACRAPPIETRRPESGIHSVAYAAPLAGRLVALEPHPLLDGVREPVGPLVEVGLGKDVDRMRRVEEGIARLPPALCHGSASVTKRSGD